MESSEEINARILRESANAIRLQEKARAKEISDYLESDEGRKKVEALDDAGLKLIRERNDSALAIVLKDGTPLTADMASNLEQKLEFQHWSLFHEDPVTAVPGKLAIKDLKEISLQEIEEAGKLTGANEKKLMAEFRTAGLDVEKENGKVVIKNLSNEEAKGLAFAFDKDHDKNARVHEHAVSIRQQEDGRASIVIEKPTLIDAMERNKAVAVVEAHRGPLNTGKMVADKTSASKRIDIVTAANVLLTTAPTMLPEASKQTKNVTPKRQVIQGLDLSSEEAKIYADTLNKLNTAYDVKIIDGKDGKNTIDVARMQGGKDFQAANKALNNVAILKESQEKAADAYAKSQVAMNKLNQIKYGAGVDAKKLAEIGKEEKNKYLDMVEKQDEERLKAGTKVEDIIEARTPAIERDLSEAKLLDTLATKEAPAQAKSGGKASFIGWMAKAGAAVAAALPGKPAVKESKETDEMLALVNEQTTAKPPEQQPKEKISPTTKIEFEKNLVAFDQAEKATAATVIVPVTTSNALASVDGERIEFQAAPVAPLQENQAVRTDMVQLNDGRVVEAKAFGIKQNDNMYFTDPGHAKALEKGVNVVVDANDRVAFDTKAMGENAIINFSKAANSTGKIDIAATQGADIKAIAGDNKVTLIITEPGVEAKTITINGAKASDIQIGEVNRNKHTVSNFVQLDQLENAKRGLENKAFDAKALADKNVNDAKTNLAKSFDTDGVNGISAAELKVAQEQFKNNDDLRRAFKINSVELVAIGNALKGAKMELNEDAKALVAAPPASTPGKATETLVQNNGNTKGEAQSLASLPAEFAVRFPYPIHALLHRIAHYLLHIIAQLQAERILLKMEAAIQQIPRNAAGQVMRQISACSHQPCP